MAGILITVSIITALSIAVLENPHIQEWLEEQRRKIAELLRSLGEELDPESRRAAEAFAYEGKTPATDAGLRREASGSKEAAALATGRSMSGSSGAVRRIPIKGPNDAEEAEERRRKGREYLAKRNQQMFEMQQRRKGSASLEGVATPTTPTSFDALVDGEGKLKGVALEERGVLPSPPAFEPVPEKIREEMREVDRQLVQPLLAGESSSSMNAFHMGSQLADPFGDEYAMERSETPRPPPVPPKVTLDREEPEEPPLVLRSLSPAPTEARDHEQQAEEDRGELSYEEQLAIALSLSEADSSTNAATVLQSQPVDEEADLRAAIEASLKDMDDQQAAHAVAHAEPLTPQPNSGNMQPLVDLTPPSPIIAPQSRQARGDWETLFDHSFSPSNEPMTLAQPPVSEADDELYSVTPELTRARLATLDAQHPASGLSSPYDPVREAAADAHSQAPHTAMEASFYSAPSSVAQPPRSETLDHEVPHPVNMTRDTPLSAPASSFGFQTDSDSETFASLTGSRAQSQARSETSSSVEVVDVVEDSDVDMLSGEEGDGIVTPDSWTEVGSRDGEESEVDPSERTRASL